jgi:hypothetical protein
LTIYDRRDEIREYEARDFGLTGTFEGYSVLVRQPDSPTEPEWLYVVATRIERDPQQFIWALDLHTRSAKQLGGGEVLANLFFSADTAGLIEQARLTHAEVGTVGFTWDGRAKFVTYYDSLPAAPSGSRETGLLLETPTQPLDLSLGELVGGRPRGDFDVVLVGDWPEP